jgi:transposase
LDLRNHSIFDVVASRGETALESWLGRLKGKHLVEVVCMDLASGYRALVRNTFPSPHCGRSFPWYPYSESSFLACWKELNPVGSNHSGLVSLIPAAGTL